MSDDVVRGHTLVQPRLKCKDCGETLPYTAHGLVETCYCKRIGFVKVGEDGPAKLAKLGPQLAQLTDMHRKVRRAAVGAAHGHAPQGPQ